MEFSVSLNHAILGFLNYKPLTGYDLKKAFDASVQHFWSADQSQIYRTLARLAERDLVEMEVVPQDGRPSRKVYHITDAGREELRRWLTTPLPPQKTRVAWLIQVFFAAQLPDAAIAALFERLAQNLRQQLAVLEEQVPAAIECYQTTIGSVRDAWLWLLTLNYGQEHHRAELRWIEGVLARLDELPGKCEEEETSS